MKKYNIQVMWQEYAVIEVDAESLDEAIELAKNSDFKPANGEYVPNSWLVDNKEFQRELNLTAEDIIASKMAEKMYDNAKDMDWMDYEEFKDTEVREIAKQLREIPKGSELWMCLENMFAD